MSSTTQSSPAAVCPHTGAVLTDTGAEVNPELADLGVHELDKDIVADLEAAIRPTSAAEQDEQERATTVGDDGGTVGILLVNHGSRSAIWRRMLLDVHEQVADELLEIPGVGQVRTAFMEYTEPSIASQLKAFDAAGIETVLVVPLLLTISDHSFDDIPTICGRAHDKERLEDLAKEGIEVYPSRATIEFAPLLDFSGLVRTNLARRIKAVMGRAGDVPGRTGLVLVGYGSAEYDDDWNRFFRQTRIMAEADLDISASTHAWCGHIARYRRKPTVDAINGMLQRTDRVLVVPLFVAYDPMFHERIIGRAVKHCDDPSRVLYTADAILPEPEVGRWVVQIAQNMLRVKQPR